jgi:hypothetical protein
MVHTLLVQMMTVLSAPPDAKRFPLKAYATAYTESCKVAAQQFHSWQLLIRLDNSISSAAQH